MSVPIPGVEPTVLVAGDTWQWDRDESDYLPADGWSLTYAFTNADQRFSLTSAPVGNAHRITVAITDSDDKIPGIYDWACFAKKTGERQQIGSGRIQIKPNLEGVRPFDTRSDARKILDGLMALHVQYAEGRGLVQEYTIAGRTMRFRDAAGLIQQLDYWKRQVAAEETSARLAAGMDSGRHIGIRFQRV
jgi:hypothetical protein